MNKHMDLMDMAAVPRAVKAYSFKRKYNYTDFVPYEVKKQLAKAQKKKEGLK